MAESLSALTGAAVLVTGAGGFIGSAVTRALVGLGAEVRALVGPPGQDAAAPPRSVTAVCADIQDRSALARLAAGARVAIHLAGPPSVAASFNAPQEYGRVHVLGTLEVLEACRAAGVARLVYVSSAEVYGRAQAQPVGEDCSSQPRSPYGAAKAAAEQFVRAYGPLGLEGVVLRPFSVFGPGLPRRAVLGTMLRQALEEEEIVVADLSPVRDYVFVDDVVAGILGAAISHAAAGSTFNLGTGSGTSVKALAEVVVGAAGRALPIRETHSERRAAETEIGELVADTTRADRELGWRAAVPLAVGVQRTLEWARTQR